MWFYLYVESKIQNKWTYTRKPIIVFVCLFVCVVVLRRYVKNRFSYLPRIILCSFFNYNYHLMFSFVDPSIVFTKTYIHYHITLGQISMKIKCLFQNRASTLNLCVQSFPRKLMYIYVLSFPPSHSSPHLPFSFSFLPTHPYTSH